MKKEYTKRGLGIIDFEDINGDGCSLEESAFHEPRIWLGKDGHEMHLDRTLALDLLPYLIGFVKDGKIKKARKWRISELSEKEFRKTII